jgi:hypothetical protein
MPFKRLEWNLTEPQQQNVKAAEVYARGLSDSIDGTVSDFTRFGGSEYSVWRVVCLISRALAEVSTACGV